MTDPRNTNRRPAAMYGIAAHANHFQVIIKRNGQAIRKTFAHSTCGGRENALVMAQAWRDEVLKAHPPISRRKKAQRILRTNTSGIPGVCAVLGPDGLPRLWTAKTHASDKAWTKSFSVSRYGEQAKALAIKEREKQLRQLKGRFVVHPDEPALRQAPAPEHRPAPSLPSARATVLKRNNSSGISGVYYKPAKENRSAYWVASTTPANAARVTRTFSVKKHGEAQAKALAIAERQRQLVALTAAFLPPPNGAKL